MYAHIVKNDDQTWDIWDVWPDEFFVSVPSRKERIDRAMDSGLWLDGQNLTEYGISVKAGSIWNGTEWTGGDPTNRTEEMNSGLFAYVLNNEVITMIVISAGSPNYDQVEAIFESENTLIRVPEGQTAKRGDIWDGTQVISV